MGEPLPGGSLSGTKCLLGGGRPPDLVQEHQARWCGLEGRLLRASLPWGTSAALGPSLPLGAGFGIHRGSSTGMLLGSARPPAPRPVGPGPPARSATTPGAVSKNNFRPALH